MAPRLFLIVATVLLASIGALHAADTSPGTHATARASHSLIDLQSLLSGGAGPGTVSLNSATAGVIALPVLNAPSTPAPSPPPRASKDSKTFRLVDPVPCSEFIAKSLMVGYQKNRAIFDECVAKCKYQIFPFTGELPTPTQITAQAIAPACTAVFTGVLLSGIPECEVSSMALKGVVETLLKITVDIREGLPCPDSQQFFNLIIWRRDSNLAQAAGLPYDSQSTLYAEYTRNLWKALTTYNVQVAADQTITYDNGNNATKSSNGSTSGRSSPTVGSGKAAVSPSTSASSSSEASDSIKTSAKSAAATDGVRPPSDHPHHSLWNDNDLAAVRVSADDIRDIKMIGSGAYVDVWLVQFRTSQLMASKRLREVEVTRARTQAFLDEITLVAALKHPNIVMFLGAAWVRGCDLQILFEYMDNGDLHTFLRNPSLSTRWSKDKLQIAIDVIEALVYAHSLSPPLTHRDVKSRNVLLNADTDAKLIDVGVSRYRSTQDTMTACIGTPSWLAPEVIFGDCNYGSAADMYSFGVLLSELDSHQIPYARVRWKPARPSCSAPDGGHR